MMPDEADAEICATAVTVRPCAMVAPGVVGASDAGSDCTPAVANCRLSERSEKKSGFESACELSAPTNCEKAACGAACAST